MSLKKSVTTAEFNSQCRKLVEKVFVLQSEFTITQDGKPIARLLPMTEPIFGRMKGKMTITGDIVSPNPEPWNSE